MGLGSPQFLKKMESSLHINSHVRGWKWKRDKTRNPSNARPCPGRRRRRRVVTDRDGELGAKAISHEARLARSCSLLQPATLRFRGCRRRLPSFIPVRWANPYLLLPSSSDFPPLHSASCSVPYALSPRDTLSSPACSPLPIVCYQNRIEWLKI
jgi:hypothetical protein